LASPPELIPVVAPPETAVPIPDDGLGPRPPAAPKKTPVTAAKNPAPEPPPPNWGSVDKAPKDLSLAPAPAPAQTPVPAATAAAPARTGVYVEKHGPAAVNLGLPL